MDFLDITENNVKTLPSYYGLPHDKWRPKQFETLQWLIKSGEGIKIVEASTGCHAKGQGILMYDGTIKNVEKITIDNILMGMDNSPRYITKIIRGNGKLFKITPVKGNSFIVSEDHILTLQRTKTIKRGKNIRKDCKDYEIIDVPLQEYINNWTKGIKHLYKLFRVPVDFSHNDKLPLSPYFLGLLIGDGALTRGITLTINSADINTVVKEIKNQAIEFNVNFNERYNSENSMTYQLSTPGKKNPITTILENLRLMNTTSENKFIPLEYKISSTENRLQILAGLFDTDGHNGGGYCDYLTKSKQLADDIAFIARSLGFAAYISKCTKGYKNEKTEFSAEYYRLSISGDLSIIPCRSTRVKFSPRKQIKSVLRTGFEVEEYGIGDFYGFTLSDDGRYLLDDFTVTHNSGKTSIATALAHERKAMSLVQTKLLQQDNYGGIYGWDILFGKGNYKCDHPDADFDTTADQCAFAEIGMQKCPVSNKCKYLVKKSMVMNSKLASLNYAYYLLSNWPKQIPYDILIMDEAHMLSDITLNYAGIEIHDLTRQEWNLPEFPKVSSYDAGSIFFDYKKPHEEVQEWIESSLVTLYKHSGYLKDIAKRTQKKEDQTKLSKCKNMISKLEATSMSIHTNSSNWFIKSGAGLIMYRGKMLSGLIARPLTARYHFKELFINNPTSVLMSATIGNINAFTEELGIDDYEFNTVPSIWKPELRPIYDLDAPRISYRSKDVDYDKQADVIADAIKKFPSNWQGVIHVSRKNEAPLLAGRLSKRGLDSRMWIPPKSGTNIQIREWEKHKRTSPGAIAITWSWTEGVDLFDEKICISAKTPFPPLGDPYEKSRQEAYPKHYSQRTAYKLIQSLGRTRRGEREHYDVDGDVNGLVAIADGNWTRIKKYLSNDILDAIKKM